jgi:hypothetical protein
MCIVYVAKKDFRRAITLLKIQVHYLKMMLLRNGTLELYTMYCTPFTASVVQWRDNLWALRKMMETGDFFVLYRVCDEEKSSEAEKGGGA